MPKPRIITLDIETAPLTSYHWGIHDESIGIEQIQQDWSILAFAYKVLGKKRIFYFDTSGRGPRHVRNDKAVLRELWAVLDAADIVVAQNGKQFDLKKINARLVQSGFKPYSPIKVIDTRIEALRKFGFTSTKLAWLAKILTNTPKDEHKKFPGFKLWTECLLDNRAAWAEMRRYNIRDVVSTEKLYIKLRPWIDSHVNVNNHEDADEQHRCPKCGSANVRPNGHSFTQTGSYPRYRCRTCGGFSRGRTTKNRHTAPFLLAN
jgi:DNA polymerase elongation subunit (family B)